VGSHLGADFSAWYRQRLAAERTFAAIWSLEAEVNNGGFAQYMFNDAGDHAVTAERRSGSLAPTQPRRVQGVLAMLPGARLLGIVLRGSHNSTRWPTRS